MTEYLRETWDLHAGAAVAMVCLLVILLWAGVAVSPLVAACVVVGGTLGSVLLGLWVLALAGGSVPW